MKFKVGDEVVYVGKSDRSLKSFIIKEVRPGLFDNSKTVYISEGLRAWDERELELASIFNSPLYQALL